ncbi:MAG TPA: prepilin-type N-terminal cleavage/methylation domain-containing protein [Candidatus Hydrogenedentes bacterium]|nr:prepilin-type N-terminal cleavage/methylation domain-containing protein [Candidatus Hydrogenedentota bacterium]
MRKHGFTLLELMMSMGILTIVSLLGFIVLASSTESAELSQVKNEAQASLRDAMAALTSEVREAYTQRTVDPVPPLAPAGAASITVSSTGDSITYYVPEPTGDATFVRASAPITILYQNEDGTGGGTTNGKLDPGEDTNGDTMLTRRLIRTQGGETTVLGSANDLSLVSFQLIKNQNVNDNNMTTLAVTLEAAKYYGRALEKVVRVRLQGSIDLKN